MVRTQRYTIFFGEIKLLLLLPRNGSAKWWIKRESGENPGQFPLL